MEAAATAEAAPDADDASIELDEDAIVARISGVAPGQSVEDAVAFTRAVGARRLVLFHHEPRHPDGQLEQLEAHAQALANGNVQTTLAREGMVIEVP